MLGIFVCPSLLHTQHILLYHALSVHTERDAQQYLLKFFLNILIVVHTAYNTGTAARFDNLARILISLPS